MLLKQATEICDSLDIPPRVDLKVTGEGGGVGGGSIATKQRQQEQNTHLCVARKTPDVRVHVRVVRSNII